MANTAIAARVAEMEPEDVEARLVRLLETQAADPSTEFFPPMLPVELAMKVDTPAKICAYYDISRERFAQLIAHPVFIKAYQEAVEMLKVDGMSFKTKAKMQAEDYLGTAYAMVKNPNIADAVRARLIECTVRWAGLDQKALDTGNGAGGGFNIQINLG
jgi:hypothetical protein